MSSVKNAAPVLLTGLLLGISFAPVNAFLVVLVALIPWMRSLQSPDSRPWRSGALFGLVFFGVQMAWLIPFVGRWTGSFALAIVPWALATALALPYFMALAWMIHAAFRLGRPWLIPFAWAAVEIVRSFIPVFAFPHGLIATPLVNLPVLIQTAAFGSVYLVGAWVVAINVALLLLSAGATSRQGMWLGLSSLALLMLGAQRYMAPNEGPKRVIAIGQLGTDLAFGDPATEQQRIGEAVDDLGQRAQLMGAELLVLPEGLGSARDEIPPPMPFSVPPVPVLFGAQRGTGPVFQSAFVHEAGKWTYFDKTRLVIFGEFVPLREQLPFLRNFNLPAGDLVPGPKVSTLDAAGIRLGPMLCFEALFADIPAQQAAMGAQLLATQSIDDWYLGSPMPDQLLAGSIFRAVENGLPLVRSASLGPTVWIDSRGHVRAHAQMLQRVALRAEVPIPPGSDAPPWRIYVPWVMLALAGALVVEGALRRSPAASESGDPPAKA